MILAGSLTVNLGVLVFFMWLAYRAETQSPFAGDPSTFCAQSFCVVRAAPAEQRARK